ncbi:MAG: GreA/GreB family elongation factor [Verrucomicrobiales bacterium]|nr:GreA/GreB family elongation factor [Verrucomicrobiales bacterium]
MSKAFTKEDDDRPEPRPARRSEGSLPPGARNYLTADGARMLQVELDRLLAGSGEGLPSLPAGSPIDAADRVAEIRRILRTATVVQPRAGATDQVRFGNRVWVRGSHGERSYRIVGVDEVDPERGWVSWISPVAKALLQRRLGDRIVLVTPEGTEELEILRIDPDDGQRGED